MDALHHDELAQAIARHIEDLPTGSVIAVHGSWGRGKTDVVGRVWKLFKARAATGKAPEPIWINPWAYGRADLIQPVVIELLSRVGGQAKARGKEDVIRDAARTLLRAGNAMAFKAVSVFVPLGSIFEAAQEPVDQFITRLMDPAGAEESLDPDPVSEMAKRFRELVDAVNEVQDLAADAPLLVCVDDIDRCLPDQQIAMLEAIHFLTMPGVNCSFLIALDPLLVQQAAIAHYRTEAIDINQYLDKLFTLRVNLTGLRPKQVEELVAGLAKDAREILEDGLGVSLAHVQDAFSAVFFVPELTNPRLVVRTFQRLRLVAAENARSGKARLGPAAIEALVAWCAIAERWPQLRQQLQASRTDLWRGNLEAVCGSYKVWVGDYEDKDEIARAALLERAEALLSQLPGPLKQPGLGYFLKEEIMAQPGLLEVLHEIDAVLLSFGL
jgi:hypothetical protein